MHHMNKEGRMSASRAKSASKLLLVSFLCIAFLFGLKAFLHWMEQEIPIEEDVQCQSEVVSRNQYWDYSRITAVMSDGSVLVANLRERANQGIFKAGTCRIVKLSNFWFIWDVVLYDNSERLWVMRVDSSSTFNPPKRSLLESLYP